MERFYLLSALFLGACAPIPHYERVAPELVGSIAEGATPARRAVVLLCEPRSDLLCDHYERHAVSSDGLFRIVSDKRLRLFTVLGDVLFQWGFDIESDGITYIGYRGTAYGIVSEERITLTCQLAGSSPKGRADAKPVCK